MTISTAPAVPNPMSTTFAADAYAFTQWMATAGAEMNAEIDRINALGFGSYSASSASALTLGTGVKSLTVEAGKGFVLGQPIVVAETATPTNNMIGTVTSYNSTTGALVVNVTSKNGTGSASAWTISVSSVVVGGGVSPDSIVVLTSGTSWTCPDGVTKAILTLVGGSGGGGGMRNENGYPGGAGGGGGGVRDLLSLTPGASYGYAIGAAGVVGTTATTNPTAGGAGGSTIWGGRVASGGTGGAAGFITNNGGMGGGGSGGSVNVAGMHGEGSYMVGQGRCGGMSAFGLSRGGSDSEPGSAGIIVLELYK